MGCHASTTWPSCSGMAIEATSSRARFTPETPGMEFGAGMDGLAHAEGLAGMLVMATASARIPLLILMVLLVSRLCRMESAFLQLWGSLRKGQPITSASPFSSGSADSTCSGSGVLSG